MVFDFIAPGRYFVGDVTGLSRPVVAIPARESIFYSDCGDYEIEIAGGGSVMSDGSGFGVFGLIEFENTGLTDDDFYTVIEVTEKTEIRYDFDYFEIVGVMKFSFPRENGLKFTSTDDEFEAAGA